jgi:hypothetical protein
VQEVKELEHYGEHMLAVGCVEQRSANIQDFTMFWKNARGHVQCLGRVGVVAAVAAEVVLALVAAVAAEVVLAAVVAVDRVTIKTLAARRSSQSRKPKDLLDLKEVHRRRKKLRTGASRSRKKGNSLESIVASCLQRGVSVGSVRKACNSVTRT